MIQHLPGTETVSVSTESEVRSGPEYGILSPGPGVRDPECRVRGTKSKVRCPESMVQDLYGPGFNSEVQGPVSGVQDPGSNVQGSRLGVRGRRWMKKMGLSGRGGFYSQ